MAHVDQPVRSISALRPPVKNFTNAVSITIIWIAMRNKVSAFPIDHVSNIGLTPDLIVELHCIGTSQSTRQIMVRFIMQLHLILSMGASSVHVHVWQSCKVANYWDALLDFRAHGREGGVGPLAADS